MAIDRETTKRLNLLKSSPSFVLRCVLGSSASDVIHPTIIPDDGSEYWVAATSILRCGRELPTIVIVWPGGETGKFFWFIDDRWMASDDAEISEALELPRAQIFPFDWTYAVPLETDPYHGG